jgi:hypothetical protein
MAAIYSNGSNRWNIFGFNFIKRAALSYLVYIRYLWYEPGKIRRRLTMSETEPQLGSISNIQHAVSANLKYRMVM